MMMVGHALAIAAFMSLGSTASADDSSVFLTFGQCDQSWECSSDLRVPGKETDAQKQELVACIGKESGRQVALKTGAAPAGQIWLDLTSNGDARYTDARFSYDGGKWGWRYTRADKKLPVTSADFCQAIAGNLRQVTAAIAGSKADASQVPPKGLAVADITPGEDVIARCGPLLDHFEPVVSTGPDDLRLGMTVEEALRTGFLGNAVKKQQNAEAVETLVNQAQSGQRTEIAVTKPYLGYKSARVSSHFECGKLMSIDVALTPYVADDWSRLAKLIKSRYRSTVPSKSVITDMKAKKRDCVASMSEDKSVSLIWRRSSSGEESWVRYGDPRLAEHAAKGCASQI